MATHLAGIVIERARAVEQLRVAKVAAEQRAQEITQALDALRTTQEALNAELAGAVDYVMSLLPRPILRGTDLSRLVLTVSAQLGGDGLGYSFDRFEAVRVLCPRRLWSRSEVRIAGSFHHGHAALVRPRKR